MGEKEALWGLLFIFPSPLIRQGGVVIVTPMAEEEFRSGFVPIVGRPNVGKSTLLNRLIGQKVAIISPKPQTTWWRILGIKTRPDAQIIFVDTPGIHRARENFNIHMVREARESMKDGDVIVHLIEATDPSAPGDDEIREDLRKRETPVLLAINKIDLLKDRGEVEEIASHCQQRFPYAGVFPISALLGDGLEELEEAIVSYLPQGPPYYPEDMITDQTERALAAEIIREKIFHLTRQEVPYSCAVVIEEFKDNPQKDLVYIRAIINVERESQKGIVIGKGGRMLKEIGSAARRELEEMLGKKVYLELWVRVQEDWRKKDPVLRDFGLIR